MEIGEFTRRINASGNEYSMLDINILEQRGMADIRSLPFTIKILVENLLRKLDGRMVREKIP